MRKRRFTAWAFSLLEVMIAIAILTIGSFAMFSAMGTSTQVARETRERTRAIQALENLLEEIQSKPLEALPSYHGAVRDLHGRPAAGETDTITTSVLHLGKGLYQVSLNAEWQGPTGPQSQTFVFLQSNRGG
ncbi:MAG: type IV pilus modification PilV family protein [Planctomycetota bacterium]